MQRSSARTHLPLLSSTVCVNTLCRSIALVQDDKVVSSSLGVLHRLTKKHDQNSITAQAVATAQLRIKPGSLEDWRHRNCDCRVVGRQRIDSVALLERSHVLRMAVDECERQEGATMSWTIWIAYLAGDLGDRLLADLWTTVFPRGAESAPRDDRRDRGKRRLRRRRPDSSSS